ncbi:MAG: Sua5 family C-terminal domain-containing protein, partial [Woeseiaceae bacterium]|nr:Sua5 family C-terminal domain-containing protein [Woeseiaceae bacterium]
VVGYLSDDESGLITAPGQLSSHYAPNATLRLNAKRRGKNEALIGFGPKAPSNALNLSKKGDTAEAASNLYRLLREADSLGVDRIAVMPIPDTGLGEAINDRLQRAAAPRD